MTANDIAINALESLRRCKTSKEASRIFEKEFKRFVATPEGEIADTLALKHICKPETKIDGLAALWLAVIKMSGHIIDNGK